MAKVLLSPSPEQELLNSVQNATIASQNEEREFHVNENAVVRGSKRDGNTVVTWESTDIFCGRDVSRVQILGTGDGESEWVDVMCPGIGLCKLQRRSLVECQHAVRMNSAANLQLQLSTRHTSTRQGFPRFMELIGPWLQSLQISFPVAGDVSWIISSCPNLSDLIIDSGTIAAQPFVSAWEENHTRLRRLECSFDDICIILNALKRESSPMAQHLKRLAFGLESFPMVPPNTPNHPVLQTLQEMFAVNRVLQNMIVTFTGNGGYCNVKAFEEGLKTYNLQELATKGDDLPMQCKTAFMSIFSCHDALSRRSKRSVRRSHSRFHLQALGADTMSTIFEFAASRGVRRIVVATLQIERPIDWWV